MGRLSAFIWSQISRWDRSAQIGLLIGIILLIPAFVMAAAGPDDLRQPAIIGTMGLTIAIQVIIMWANRGMVTDFTKAQRLYRDGSFQQARSILEGIVAGKEAVDFQVLTLLGNTYRQLGMLEQSHRVLYEARNNHPDHYFPLYGFGRTLLVQGHYAEAAENIALALERGAPPAVYFDLGEAHYREHNPTQAVENLHIAREYAEPHRRLMAIYLLHQLGESDPPDQLLVEQGIAYWQAQADLFAETPYGQALAEDIDKLRAMTTQS